MVPLGAPALAGYLLISVADAPQWELRPYVGWTVAMVALAFVGDSFPQLADPLAWLLVVGLIMSRQERLTVQARRVFGT